ncbi:MAG: UMP kinase [Xanthobacteraceae bacterium]
MGKPAYKRVLVKVSGEALMGSETYGLHAPTIGRIASDLAEVRKAGVEIAAVVGGGNLIRGALLAETGLNRATADQMGMLATVINALALEGAIERTTATVRTLSAVSMPSVCEPYARQTALKHLKDGHVVLLAGGTGQPFFTTDTGAALRAAELGCDAIFKATNVDGVYDSDPNTNRNAKRYDRLTHDEALAKDLKVLDAAAFALAREAGLPIIVFSIREKGAIMAAVRGEGRSTAVMP